MGKMILWVRRIFQPNWIFAHRRLARSPQSATPLAPEPTRSLGSRYSPTIQRIDPASPCEHSGLRGATTRIHRVPSPSSRVERPRVSPRACWPALESSCLHEASLSDTRTKPCPQSEPEPRATQSDAAAPCDQTASPCRGTHRVHRRTIATPLMRRPHDNWTEHDGSWPPSRHAREDDKARPESSSTILMARQRVSRTAHQR